MQEDPSKKVSNDDGDDLSAAFGTFMKGLVDKISSVEVVTSTLSKNRYVLIGEKDGSKVGVSSVLSLVPHKDATGQEVPALGMILRFLEVPEAGDTASVFANAGDTREYQLKGQNVVVNMLQKRVIPLCPPAISPANLRKLLVEGPGMEVVNYVWETLEKSEVAINCKDKEELLAHLFPMLESLPEEDPIYWEPLKAQDVL